MTELQELKKDFMEVFANLPIPERKMPIYVDEKHGALSWSVCWLEINGDTMLGFEILERLRRMNLI